MAFPESKYGQVALYQEAHKRCHHDGSFSRYIQRYLNRKHASLIKRVATNSPEIARLTIENMLMASDMTRAEDLAGFLWAITSDPRPELRAVEQGFVEELHLLSHRLLLAQFQGDVVVSSADNTTPQLAAYRFRAEGVAAHCRTPDADGFPTMSGTTAGPTD
jgi:hypothetical protein